MATEVASLFVRFFAKDEGVSQAFEEVQRETERASSLVRTHGERMASAFQAAGERMRSAGEGLIDMGDNLSQALSLPFIVVGGAAAMAAVQTDQAMSIINANFGNNAQLAAAYGEIVQNALRSGIAESAQQAALDVVTLAQTFGRLKPETMQVVAEKAQAMAMAMDTSVDDIASRAKELKDTFGISLSQALDLVARGFDVDKVKAVGLKNALNQSRGAAQQMAQEMMNSPVARLRGQWNQLLQTLVPLGGILLDLANQILPRIVSAVQSAMQWFQGLSDTQQNLVVGFGVLAIVIPPVIMFLGALAMSAGALVSAMAPLAGLLGGLISPIGAVIAGVAALATMFVILWNRSATFRAFFVNMWTSIQTQLMTFWATIQPIVMAAMNAVATFIIQKVTQIRTWWMTTWPMLRQAFINIWNGIVAVARPIMAALMQVITFIWPIVRGIIVSVWGNIKGAISGALNIIMGLVTAFAALFTGNWSRLWAAVKQILRGAWELIWNLVQLYALGKIMGAIGRFGGRILSSMRSTWNSAASVVRSAWERIWSAASGFASRILSRIMSAWNSLVAETRAAYQEVYNAVTSPIRRLISQAGSWGRELIDMFVGGIESMFGRLESAVEKAASIVSGFLGFHSPTEKGPASDSDRWAPNFVNMYAEGLKRGAPKIAGVVNSMAESLSALSAPTSTTSTASPGHTFNINVYTDDRRIGRTIARNINRELWLHHA